MNSRSTGRLLGSDLYYAGNVSKVRTDGRFSTFPVLINLAIYNIMTVSPLIYLRKSDPHWKQICVII